MLEDVVTLFLHHVSVLMCRYHNIDFSAIIDISLMQYTSRINNEFKNISFSDSCNHLQQRVIEAVAEIVDDCWAKKNDVKKIDVIKDFWNVDSSMNDERWRIDERLLSMQSESFYLVKINHVVIFAVKCEKNKWANINLVTCQRESANKRDHVVVVKDVIENLFCHKDYHVECSFLSLQMLNEVRVISWFKNRNDLIHHQECSELSVTNKFIDNLFCSHEDSDDDVINVFICFNH